ncbi:MAG: hypothetical protein WDW36_009363 [Sanguina aurantia]
MLCLHSKPAQTQVDVANDVATYNSGNGSGPAGGKGPAPSNPALTAAAPGGSSQRPASAELPAHLSDPVLQFLLRNVRSKNVRQQFSKTAPKEYTDTRTVKIMVGSYNVNGKKAPPGLTVHEWLGRWKESWPTDSSSDTDDVAFQGPDLIAVGFQEIVPLSAGNVIGVSVSTNAVAWDRVLAATLNGEEWASKQFGPSPAAAAAAGSSAPLAPGAEAAVDSVPKGVGQGPESTPGLSAGPEDGGKYIQVACKQMVGTYISVWARKALLPHVKGVQVAYVATGFGGYLGNKGAVAVRLRVYDSPLCFVNCHLSSGDQEGDAAKRHADVAEILRRCAFSPTVPEAMSSVNTALISAALGPGHWGAARALLEQGSVIWVGDLNYRLSCGDDEARGLMRAGAMDALLASDELGQGMRAGRVFQGWKEGPVAFMPTFKYKVGTNTYLGEAAAKGLPPGSSSAAAAAAALSKMSTALTEEDGEEDEEANGTADPPSAPAASPPSGTSAPTPPTAPLTDPRPSPTPQLTASQPPEKQKRRTPAWCDRVLWVPGRGLRQLAYGRAELALSDHKPVAAAFVLAAQHYNRDRIGMLLDEARKELDRHATIMRPKCSLEVSVLPLGRLQLGQVHRCRVVIRNVGGVEGFFHFVPPPSAKGSPYSMEEEEAAALPAWLSVEPAEGLVAAGSTATLELTVSGPCSTATLELTVCVEGGPGGSAGVLSAAANDYLDAISILRVEDNCDMFVSLTGSYIKSSLGQDLERLAAYGSQPVAAAGSSEAEAVAALSESLSGWSPTGQQPASLSSPPSTGSSGVPKELGLLLASLSAPESLATPGIFVTSMQAALTAPPGDPSPAAGSSALHKALLTQLVGLRSCLDLHLSLPPATPPHHTAAMLLLFLSQLPAPLLPQAVADVCSVSIPLSAEERLGLARPMIQSSMGPTARALLQALVALFQQVLQPPASSLNGVTLAQLSPLLCTYLFSQPAPGLASSPDAGSSRIALLALLLAPGSKIL